MLAAAAAPSGSDAVVAVVAVRVVRLPVLRQQVAEGRAHLAHKLLPVVLPHLRSLLLPQVVVESEVRLHLQGRQSFSAAMARSSPPTVQPTYGRAPSTRSPPNGRLCPSACRNWMPVRG